MVEGLAQPHAAGVSLADALAHVPGWRGGDADAPVRMAGGAGNSTWRVRTSHGEFAVRLHAPDRAALGADPAREVLLHGLAADAGLAPPIVHADPRGRFLVTVCAEGEPWRAEDMGDADRLAALGALLGRLQAIPAPSLPVRDLGELAVSHAARIARAGPRDAGRLQALTDRAVAIWRALAAEGRPPCIVHGDLHHANVIGSERPRLVDWEYAAVADPILDPACVLAYYAPAERHAELLLESTGLAACASPEGLRRAAWVLMLVSLLWHRVRRLAGGAADEAPCTEESQLLARLEG